MTYTFARATAYQTPQRPIRSSKELTKTVAMCKVVKYWFACHHGSRIQHSRCGGTKHKSTRSGLATACKSEPYLSFVFAFDCGPCQHQAFEDGWKHKLRVAEIFLEKLKQKGLPGVRKVEALVEQLNDDFNSASWNTRTLYPHAHKDRTVRSILGQFNKVSSPLSREVLPPDLSVPLEIVGPDHPNYEYDWDYIASTDPVHPVDTSYAHSLNEVDPSWMLGHLSPEEFERSGEGVGFNASETDTVWGSSLDEISAQPTTWVEDSPAWSYDDIAPEESLGTTALESQTKPNVEDEDLLLERVAMVTRYFWSVVNVIPASEQASQATRSVRGDDLDNAFKSLHIADFEADAETPNTGLPTPPSTPTRLSTDESCGLDASTLSSPSPLMKFPSPLLLKIGPQSLFPVSQFAAVPAPKPSSSYDDRRRQYLPFMKNADRVRYNSELLHLSRCKVRDTEGPNGRSVVDPQLPRDGAAKTGWWK